MPAQTWVRLLLVKWKPIERRPVSLLFHHLYTDQLSTSKLAQQHVSKIHISRKEWPLLRYEHLWPHFRKKNSLLPLPRPESKGRVAIWGDHSEMCGNLKAEGFWASYQEPQKGSIKTCSVCRSGLSKCCTPSSPGKLKGHQSTFCKRNLAPLI